MTLVGVAPFRFSPAPTVAEALDAPSDADTTPERALLQRNLIASGVTLAAAGVGWLLIGWLLKSPRQWLCAAAAAVGFVIGSVLLEVYVYRLMQPAVGELGWEPLSHAGWRVFRRC